MHRRMRDAVILLVAMGTVGWFAAGASSVLAAQKSSDSKRTETWEFTLPVRYLPSTEIKFDHGSSINVHDDIGWGFGIGYNFNERFNLGFEFAWTSANYKATIASAGVQPDYQASGTLDATSSTFNFTYNILPKHVTPYLTVSGGWSWIDSNIPNGPPQTGCWWDPWYGYICTSYVDTRSESGFSYGFGAGLRVDVKESFFLRFGVNDTWQDYGNYSSSAPDIVTYRVDMGWKF
jgi:opacity protein-like surface antigen